LPNRRGLGIDGKSGVYPSEGFNSKVGDSNEAGRWKAVIQASQKREAA